MITANAVVTLGRYMHGGYDGLKNHIRCGGRLPFEYDWSYPCHHGQVGDMEVVSALEIISMLESL